MEHIAGLRTGVTLAPYSTYAIGGPADYFVAAQSKQHLRDAIAAAQKVGMPFFILGCGANVLFGDKGFRGMVIKNEARAYRFEDTTLIAESGATIEELIHASAERNLSGMEHFAGIPSTVGGALWQNLHFLSPDRTRTVFIAEIFERAEIVDTNGNIHTLDARDFEFGYDHSILHTQTLIVLEARFVLHIKPKNEILAQAAANLAWRAEKQPDIATYPSCGSVFKKIDGIGAGRLIDQVGLKGARIGGIAVSEKHANFLVNMGGGTASDVRALIAHIQERVRAETGHLLEPEISFIGEF